MISGPSRPERSALLRLAAFAPLCAFAAAHWAALVSEPPGWRVAAVVGVATACGGALQASARLEGRGARSAQIARTLTVATCAAAAFAAIGLPLGLLAPGGWSALATGLGLGFDGLLNVEWPYDGGDPWVRLTVLLAVPIVAIVAATLAFWPQAPGVWGREAVAVRQAAALGVLLSLLGVAAAERPLPAALGRGVLLFVLLAAWLFPPGLPRVRFRIALAAGASVLVTGLVSLPLAVALEPDRPWIDYRSWALWGGGGSAAGSFEWDHSYGPIDWPRTGETMLEVRSEQPHYWRVEALDRFDGYAWRSSGRHRAGGAAVELPLATGLEERWRERLGFTVRGLRSGVLAAAGTPLAVEGAGLVAVFADGTVEPLGRSLAPGDSYGVRTYVPNPSAREMRASAGSPPPFARDYTEIDLPPSADPEETAVERAGTAGPLGESITPPVRVSLGVADDPAAADPGAQARILASPYADVYRLARRLARGRATSSYDTVRAIERHLRRGYDYGERPPAREHPLASFLLSDRVGYCQQFSGAMALMLRMNRIPARVATGFAPGLRQARGRWRVRDLDAHSWVEVLFPGIGWVAFDPTPSSAPAERPGDDAEADAVASASAAGSERRRPRRRNAQDDPRASAERPAAQPRAQAEDGTSPTAAAVVLLSVCAAAAGAWRLGLLARLHARGRGERSPEEEVAELRAALELLGYQIPPGTTLAALEHRLVEGPGPAAARYVRRLRERRFAVPAPGGSAPRPDRRALRGALTAGLGPLGRLRGFLALPPAALAPRR
jgi:transglutaminase-like putative cysteine protease